MSAKKLVSTVGMAELEWLKWRRAGIGGSDAPAICGLSRWGNPLSVYMDKVSTTPPTEGENRFYYWGHELEPVVAKEFQKRSGLKVRSCNFILQHPDYPWMLANIDREVIDPEHGRVGLECKNASQYKAKEWEGDQTPEEYIVQCSHYMMVTNSPVWYLAVLIGGNDFAWRKLTRDLELEKYLFGIEDTFWKLVEARTPPAIGEDGEMFGLTFKPEPPSVILPPELLPKIERYKELTAAIKGPEKELKAIKDELNTIMEVVDPECELFLCGETQLSRKKISTQRFDTTALKEEDPETYGCYLKESISRRLTVK